MSDEKPSKKDETDFEAATRGGNASLGHDVLTWLREKRKMWLLPILTVFLLLAILLLVSTTAVGPLIYTIF